MRRQKMATKWIHPHDVIVQKIYLIRNEKVMLDYDLAMLYGVETKRLKEQVRRNISRFPGDFMFELSSEEWKSLRSQFATLKRGRHQKYSPFAFTEQGIAMLSSVLNSENAIKVNIEIIRQFVRMRQLISSHKELLRKITEMEKSITDHDEKIMLIFQTIKELLEPAMKKRKPIGFRITK